MALIEDRFEDTLLIVRGDPPAALVVPHGERWVLPVVQTRDHHPADLRPTRKAIRQKLGIDGFVLDCLDVEVGTVPRGWRPAGRLAARGPRVR